ncbi:Down syndrome cell adhesion molecule-like protein Dscam2 isoform X35 [Anopheles arabiensis]|uniref:Down syndrome cell adhesion molecule-like protein Dscam2 isoform X35 n=1 Tax=Anopheles arabiensis TaxID=7173 RepID=UPI001AACDCDA|nr:Down syndrome cell adhesion molecule-like protein Dscam2 isoform X35 [Anopheles arabiensis]XP_049465888.1 Down syndrome cell adhesion molecule-like protein Dscam2 isoform X32 [Anopheles coluzzii]XP_061517357.1 cell adhesion molecule Dscam2 isoform X28 [Anopheles gambiae]
MVMLVRETSRTVAIATALLCLLSGFNCLNGVAGAGKVDDSKGPVFLKEPTNRIDFSNSTGAVVECSATGNPPPEMIWIRSDGTAVGDVPGLRQILPNGNLVFPPFRAEDYRQEVHAQVYACMAKNQFGSVISRDVNVRAVVNQYYVTEAENEYIIRGNSAILKCKIPSFIADFVSIDAWIDDSGEEYNQATNSEQLDGKYMVLPSGELHIREVGPEDGYKSYQCRTKHRLTGETRLSATKGRLVITEPIGSVAPRLTSGDAMRVQVERVTANATLLCPAQSFPVPAFRWYKYIEGTQQKKAVVLDDRVKQVSGTLIIKDAVVDDSGKYLCVVNNSVGGESVETVLTVTAPLAAKIEPRTQTVDFGRPAVFTCKFSGNPIKTVSWMKDGKSLGHSDAVLRIESVKKEDKGMYQCFIRNDQESAQASAELKLGGRFDPPIIREAFPEETRHPGPSVFLKCVAGGNPTPEISWELDGKKITNSERYQVGQYVTVNGDVVSHLNITSIHSNDGGLYKCMASSKVGVAEHSAKLNVYGLPYVRTMEKKAIVAGETLIVTCPVAGYPIESIVWERDNRQLPINRKQKVFPNGTLIIENVERNSDQATYTCVAKNSEGYTARGTLEVQVMAVPQIMPFEFGEEPFDSSSTVSVQCVVTKGDVPIDIGWMFNGRRISSNDGITVSKLGQKMSTLYIESIRSRHAGNYTCRASNAAGSVEHSSELKVIVPPRWILEPTDKAFAQGSNAKVECKADGFPKPQVTWKKAVGDTPGEYKDLRSNDSSIRVEEGSLFIQNIQKSNEGYYLCEAINGIGSGLSAVTLITVQAPPEFVEKLRNQTARRGEPSVLQCEAKGEKPIGILWNMNNIRLDPKSDNRYTIREEILPNGVTSSLSIKRTERSDSALFTCMATNAFGSDDTSINMIIQEVPEMPYALKVLDKSGRTVQLSWAKPYDGNSPLKRYIIEFKRSRGSWENDIDRVIVPGDTNEAQVQKLSPATTYNIRIVAENEIGVSDPSDVVTIITAEEAPSGKPQAIKVEAINQATLRVSWKAPPRAEWNGDILGYYVGYKQTSLNTLYVYETVNYSPEGGEGKEHSLEINNLKTYTQYSIVIQAFNKVGAGPMSDEEKQYTAEGTPDQPPSDTMCTTLTSQTIRVSWVSPPLESANGVIKGYKVVYAPSDLWNNDKNKDYKKTASSDTVLHGLKKYTNYTMQVLATTSGGDGVRSAPIHCQTEQDVPEAPTAVKALVMSEGSIFVSWQPPAQPNGLILQYTVYIKSGDQEPKSFKVPSYQINYEASGLEKNQKYEFWVTASTTIGEGQSSKTLSAMPSDKVPAKIASFDDKFTATFKEDAKLPCLAVGSPAPEITWKIKGVEFVPNERIRQLPEGSLFIKDVIRQDAGDYTCTAENSIAKDSITHRLIVLAPPQSPQLTLTATTTDSLSVKLKPHESDTAPLQGYTLHYKPEFGEWETIDVALEAPKYTIEKLYCGSRYQVYATAYNSIGAGEPSDILNTRTKGSKPLLPEKSRFIEVSSNSITLHLPAWKDGGCRMSHFVVEHKKKDQIDWNQISNNVKPGGNFVVLDLEPATWYNLRVTAHNNAGFTVAEYEFATLTITGGTVAPIFGSVQPGTIYPPWIPHWIDLNVMVPLIATVIVVAVGVLVICVAISRRRDDDPRCGPKDVYYDVVYNQSMGPAGAATLDKRRPDIRDELGYIAPPNRKLPPVPGSNYNTCDRVKRGTVISHNPSIKSNHTTWDPRRPLYEELKKAPPPLPRRFNHPPACYGMEDEICPYATFHLLGFREEMDPTKAMNFQTFPHQNGMGGPGHMGTMGSSMAMQVPSHVHSRSGSQSMPRQNRYARKNSQGGQSSIYTPAPEYDDPANCAEEDQYRRYTRINSQGGSLYCGPGPEYDDPANCAPEDDQYGSQYGGNYGTPYEHYGSRGSVGRRSVGSPEPPPPPPRNHDTSNSSFNDSKESNEISEAECDRDNGPRGNYGEPSEASSKSNDAINGDETEKLLKRNEVKPKYTKQTAASGSTGLTAYDTMAV